MLTSLFQGEVFQQIQDALRKEFANKVQSMNKDIWDDLRNSTYAPKRVVGFF